MGVHGLWRLIEPSGKPVPLETLENKVLAVDVSIWLHQAIKGFQDSKGAPIPNAHLLGIYHRVCKLLYFKIKPVFVFDGGVPVLKRQTIAKRNQQKSRNTSEADRLQKQLLNTLMKHTAISKVLSEKTKASLTTETKTNTDTLYALPPSELDSTISSDDEVEESTSGSTDSSPTKKWDLHTIDMNSVHFKSLPVDVRHEILTELKDTRKQNSWGRLHELPKQSDDFSSYQMSRLLKRQAVQAALDEAAQEMGGMSLSIAELESILKDRGIQTTTDNIGKRIASDENTRYLFIKDVKQAMEKARQEQLAEDSKQTELASDTNSITENMKVGLEEDDQLQQAIELSLQESTTNNEMVDIRKEINKTKADIEEETQLEQAIALSLQETPSTSGVNKGEMVFSYSEHSSDVDLDSGSDEDGDYLTTKKSLSSAQSYMMEYSGLTPSEISKIIEGNGKKITRKNTMEKSLKPVYEKNIVIDSSSNEMNDESEEKMKKRVFQLEKNENNAEAVAVSENNELQDDSKNDYSSSQKDIEPKEVIEIVSNDDDGSSDSSDFQEVSELKVDKTPLEIVIDPNKDIDDDIFKDIFANEVITTETEIDKNENQSNLHAKQMDKIVELPEISKISEVTNEQLPMKMSSEDESNISMADKEEVKNMENGSRKDEVVETSKVNYEIDDGEKISRNIPENSKGPTLTIQEMTELKKSLQKERTDLLIEKSTKERLASNITDQMYQEAQELLELFGVPYIIAPMEAEAQCAFLDEIELTDGTITDDSDVWLFGGRTVYKNFFNQSKYVMEFKSENIRHHFKLSREQMILLALLVGSDYTTGIQGIGPVTALEILAAFPPDKLNEFSISQGQLISGLREFRSWFTKGKTGGPSRSTLKNKLKNITFSDNFPSLQVVQAYLEPTVENSKEKFSWDKPDAVALALFAKEKFGWGSRKTEEILNPVIKRLEENRSQKSIREYFKTKFKVDSGDLNEKMSNRVKTAIGRFGKSKEELITEDMEELEKEKRTIINKSRRTNQASQQRRRKEAKHTETEEQNEFSQRSKKKRTSKPEIKNAPTKTNESIETQMIDDNVETVDNKVQQSSVKMNKKGNKKKKYDAKESHKNTAITQEDDDSKTNNSDEKVDDVVTESVNPVDELKEYENLATQLRMRRRKKNELIKLKQEEVPNKKTKLTVPKQSTNLPIEPEIDEAIKLLTATTSRSIQREQEIQKEMKKKVDTALELSRSAPMFHKEEVIHQRLRNRSDLLKNKLRAIEVFRKSKKGPGYVQKRGKKQIVPKEDAGLSEDSD
ncbi:unnamed protein product [Phaedon cochleariae]|uniref:G protein gamma domain-containing protein n=1 Tax=Phaedon cochleariae TaxID=80249 RepID=A0A9P0DZM6_PHACE|nr:unnamed protein product [Phaedon cochleariae]